MFPVTSDRSGGRLLSSGVFFPVYSFESRSAVSLCDRYGITLVGAGTTRLSVLSRPSFIGQ